MHSFMYLLTNVLTAYFGDFVSAFTSEIAEYNVRLWGQSLIACYCFFFKDFILHFKL